MRVGFSRSRKWGKGARAVETSNAKGKRIGKSKIGGNNTHIVSVLSRAIRYFGQIAWNNKVSRL